MKGQLEWLAGILLAVALAVGAVAPASAGASTFTQRFHRETIPIFDPLNPCAPAIGTGVVNGVAHFTQAANGSVHSTITLTGSFDVTLLDSGANATGHFTFWAGQNINLVGNGGVRNSETFTLSAHGKADDGSTVRFNIVTQLRQVDGEVKLFFLKAQCH